MCLAIHCQCPLLPFRCSILCLLAISATLYIADGTCVIQSSAKYIFNQTIDLTEYTINDLMVYFNSKLSIADCE
jgi:hypothetical protein